ncbi:MAG: hypothetical protein HZA50_17500 [Planctomycetes bacterium]|nr:hypothetical protein [Planctomycetota bacterium]
MNMAFQFIPWSEPFLPEIYTMIIGAAFGLILPFFVINLDYRIKRLKSVRFIRRIIPCGANWLIGIVVVLVLFPAGRECDTRSSWDRLASAFIFSVVSFFWTRFLIRKQLSRPSEPSPGFSLTSLVMAVCLASVLWGALTLARNMRLSGKWAADQSNMICIHKALTKYESKYGHAPHDLCDLINDGNISIKALVSPLTPHMPPHLTTIPAIYDGPCDYNYIPLPPDAPGDLLLAWTTATSSSMDPRYSNVLYRSGQTQMIYSGDLPKLRDATLFWLKSKNLPAIIVPASTGRPATQPTSKPVSSSTNMR